MRAATSKQRVLVHPSDAKLPADQQTRFHVRRVPPVAAARIEDECTEQSVVVDPETNRVTRTSQIKQAQLLIRTVAAALTKVENLLDAEGQPIELPTEHNVHVDEERVATSALDAVFDMDVLIWLFGQLGSEGEKVVETGELSSQPTSSTTTS